MCCTGQTVLGVDKTFNLCNMHVTVTCYKQLSVIRQRTGQPPIFIGPVFVHDNSDFESYCHFFHHLKMKLVDIDLTKLVIGTDDETAMVKAITTAFPNSTHVLCTRHLRENTMRKLIDDAVDKKDRNLILDKIYGLGGIMDADDTICFQEKCENFEPFCREISSKFMDYFKSRLKNQLLTKVNGPTRLDLIDDEWTNNNCESVNHMLKQIVEWKSKPLTEFVSHLNDLVDGQFKDLRSALIGTGEYRLADNYKQFQISKTNWVTHYPKKRQTLHKIQTIHSYRQQIRDIIRRIFRNRGSEDTRKETRTKKTKNKRTNNDETKD